MFLLLLLQVSAGVGIGFDLARARPSAPAPCAPVRNGEVVVCGSRADRHRLPLPRETSSADGTREADGLAAITPAGRCGIFAGERRCAKREALAHGYGGGRDPLTVAIGAVAAIVDPDR